MAFPISLSFNKFNGLSKIDVAVSSLDLGGLVKLSMIWHNVIEKVFTLLTELIEMLTCNSCFLFTSSFELHGEDKLLEIKLEVGNGEYVFTTIVVQISVCYSSVWLQLSEMKCYVIITYKLLNLISFCYVKQIVWELKRMTVLKRYVLRLFISLKYITANVVDRNNGRIVATASTVEHSIKNSLECGRSCNAKAGTVVGEVLAMRLKVEGLEQGQGRGIHVDVNKEVEKKGFKNRTKVWAVVNALKNHGVKVVLEDNEDNPSRPSF
ncbi:hypothetical protein Gohar_019139 [Gossypium harknessii]|uniref:50S ribosomal protein L18-like n=1 Tax=Gossypium harknessii TaxID=34285 RepID=A0A7J9GCJ9_9ROSI|nr:hypothetical protein [Gossypium harknessii]